MNNPISVKPGMSLLTLGVLEFANLLLKDHAEV